MCTISDNMHHLLYPMGGVGTIVYANVLSHGCVGGEHHPRDPPADKFSDDRLRVR